MATTRIQVIGSIFSTSLVGDGVVYIGSTDGNLYAISSAARVSSIRRTAPPLVARFMRRRMAGKAL